VLVVPFFLTLLTSTGKPLHATFQSGHGKKWNKPVQKSSPSQQPKGFLVTWDPCDVVDVQFHNWGKIVSSLSHLQDMDAIRVTFSEKKGKTVCNQASVNFVSFTKLGEVLIPLSQFVDGEQKSLAIPIKFTKSKTVLDVCSVCYFYHFLRFRQSLKSKSMVK
jgi:hypothetical protein